MIGLTIQNIEISVEVHRARFTCNIPLEDGLNIIRADNSSGKSTCVNAIAYGLGLEAILGPARKRPFPKSLYDTVLDSKKTKVPYQVLESRIQLKVQNQNGVEVYISRDVKGDTNKVSVLLCDDSQGGDLLYGSGDYFLGSAGEGLGSAVSERGFHHWLAGFIGWDLPLVPTYNGKDCPLYLECIFPLFFIEQKRGWSEIQANSPMQYGIKNIKKSALEFCLSIDGFEHDRKITAAQNAVEVAEVQWKELQAAAEGVADYNTVRIAATTELGAKEPKLDIEFSYMENDTFICVENQLKSLRRLFTESEGKAKPTVGSNEQYEKQSSVVRNLRRTLEVNSGELELALLSEPDVDGKIETLNHDYNQYRQLQKLKTVGSQFGDLDTDKCPICEGDLYDTLGTRKAQRAPMTLEENIEFLKNQLTFFQSIKAKNSRIIDQLQVLGRNLYTSLEQESAALVQLEDDLSEMNGAVKSRIREDVRLQALLQGAEKLWKAQQELNGRASRIQTSWSLATKSLKQLRRTTSKSGRSGVINSFSRILGKNLESFGFSTSEIQSVTISPRTLRPEQEGYDIVAETSASDYIRIIWSYTLALLELAKKPAEVRHGGFVVFDEPRQHEASKFSFTQLIGKAATSQDFGGQVIFATSLDESELKEACVGRKVNLVCFDDYILQPAAEQKESI